MKKLLLLITILSCYRMYSQTAECASPAPDQQYYHKYKKTIEQASMANNFNKRTIVDVPVQIYLFKNSSGNSNVSISQIRSELDSVNTFYANANIRLVECGAPEIITSSTLYDYSYNQQSFVLSNHYTPNVINIYFVNTITIPGLGQACGYSAFPPSADYVFMAASCATNGSTLAHELGHYFGLPHTHETAWGDELVDQSNCTVGGDLICDTPADPGLSNSSVDFNCDYIGNYVDATGTPYAPDPYLIMSYSRKTCRNVFTPMQYAVINTTFTNDRSYLYCPNVSAINTNNKDNTDIKIYPNPANDYFEINLNNKQIANIKIIDIQGKEVYNQKGVLKGDKIDLLKFENGYYYIQIEINNVSINKPLIILSK